MTILIFATYFGLVFNLTCISRHTGVTVLIFNKDKLGLKGRYAMFITNLELKYGLILNHTVGQLRYKHPY